MPPTPPADRARGDARSLTERVYDELRRAILLAELPPGETIVEPQLAVRFQTSKTPVREALRLLMHDELVLSLPRKGYVVRPLGFQDLLELLRLREILEPGIAADAAARREHADLDALHDVLRAHAAANAASDEELRLAHEFHRRLGAAAHNGRADRILAMLLFDSERLWHVRPPVSRAALRDDDLAAHTQILAAVQAGDGAAASAAMAAHLDALRVSTLGVVR